MIVVRCPHCQFKCTVDERYPAFRCNNCGAAVAVADAPRADAQQQKPAMVISCPQCKDEVHIPDGATSFFCKTCGYEGATTEALLPAAQATAHAEDGEAAEAPPEDPWDEIPDELRQPLEDSEKSSGAGAAIPALIAGVLLTIIVAVPLLSAGREEPGPRAKGKQAEVASSGGSSFVGSVVLWAVEGAAIVTLGIYLLVPLIVMSRTRYPRTPELGELDQEEFDMLPQDFSAYFHRQLESLGIGGFEAVKYLTWDAAGVRNTMALCANHARKDMALINIVEAGDPMQIKERYVEISTKYNDGTVIDCNTASTIPALPMPPGKRVIQLADLRDIHQLYWTHKALCTHYGPDGASETNKLMPPRGREVEFLQKHIIEDFEYAVSRGYFRVNESTDEFVMTLKGAYLMTWNHLPPLSWMNKSKRRKQAEAAVALSKGVQVDDDAPRPRAAQRGAVRRGVAAVDTAAADDGDDAEDDQREPVDDSIPEDAYEAVASDRPSFLSTIPRAFAYPFTNIGAIIFLGLMIPIWAILMSPLAGVFGLIPAVIIMGTIASYMFNVMGQSGIGNPTIPASPEFGEPGEIVVNFFRFLFAGVAAYVPVVLVMCLGAGSIGSLLPEQPDPMRMGLDGRPLYERDVESGRLIVQHPRTGEVQQLDTDTMELWMRNEQTGEWENSHRPILPRDYNIPPEYIFDSSPSEEETAANEQEAAAAAAALMLSLVIAGVFWFIGSFYFPMALIMNNFGGSSFAAFRYDIAFPLIFRVFGHYLICVLFMVFSSAWQIVFSAVALTVLVATAGFLGFIVAFMVSSALNLYLFLVAMRLLGNLYYCNHDKIGVFG